MFPFSTATRKSSTASDNDAFLVSACVDLFGEKLLLQIAFENFYYKVYRVIAQRT